MGEPFLVTEPGLYDGIPDDVYHADPVEGGSLSATGAKRLLPPSAPAAFRWEQDNQRPYNRNYEIGHAAHAEILGVGAEIVVVDAKGWTTKAAREKRDNALEEGKTPLLADEATVVEDMVAALRSHPLAVRQFGAGKPEQSMFFHDGRIWRRGRVDWMNDAVDGHMVIVDYKTAISAAPDEFGRSAVKFGYHIQAAWYRRLAISLGLAETVSFRFVVQEKTAPYLVSVIELDDRTLDIGDMLGQQAARIYADCVESGVWPGYQPQVHFVSAPGWYLKMHDPDAPPVVVDLESAL